MSKLRRVVGAALAAVMLAWPALASAECKLLQIAEFKLDPNSASPIVDGSINGRPVKVALDTGAQFSMITSYQAAKLGLAKVEAIGHRASGIGGDTQIYWAHVDRLKVGDLSRASIDLAVAGDPDRAADVGLIMGADLLSQADVEFDLAHNAIRMFAPTGCTAPQLVYWGAAYSQVELLPLWRDAPALQTHAYLNGKPILAEVDSGSETSLVDASAAAAHGVTRLNADGPAGSVHGAGPKPVKSWIGRFDTFAIGDEWISHVKILVTNFQLGMGAPSMFIGDDFLRAHRVFVDKQDHLILFSYQGGTVFSPSAARGGE